MSMLGKFVMISGENYYHTGKIVEEISPNVYMIEFGGGENPSYRHIFHLNSMLATTEADGTITTSWTIFNTQEELEIWLAQINELAEKEEIETEENPPLKYTLQ